MCLLSLIAAALRFGDGGACSIKNGARWNLVKQIVGAARLDLKLQHGQCIAQRLQQLVALLQCSINYGKQMARVHMQGLKFWTSVVYIYFPPLNRSSGRIEQPIEQLIAYRRIALTHRFDPPRTARAVAVMHTAGRKLYSPCARTLGPDV